MTALTEPTTAKQWQRSRAQLLHRRTQCNASALTAVETHMSADCFPHSLLSWYPNLQHDVRLRLEHHCRLVNHGSSEVADALEHVDARHLVDGCEQDAGFADDPGINVVLAVVEAAAHHLQCVSMQRCWATRSAGAGAPNKIYLPGIDWTGTRRSKQPATLRQIETAKCQGGSFVVRQEAQLCSISSSQRMPHGMPLQATRHHLPAGRRAPAPSVQPPRS